MSYKLYILNIFTCIQIQEVVRVFVGPLGKKDEEKPRV